MRPMTTFPNLSFIPLNGDGSNFLTWSAEMKLFLASKDLVGYLTNDKPDKFDTAKSAEATLIILQHLEQNLKMQYINAKTSKVIWSSISTRFGDVKKVLGPTALSDWNTLRFQDYKTVSTYVTDLFNVCERLTLCGYETLVTEPMRISKTLTTFPPEAAMLATQYSNMNFNSFNELITVLYTAESQQLLLIKNSNKAPQKDTTIVTETNFIQNKQSDRSKSYNNYKGKRNGPSKQPQQKKPYNAKNSSKKDDVCYKCGTTGHRTPTCRTPQHLIELYLASKTKGHKPLNEQQFAGSTEMFPITLPGDEANTFFSTYYNDFIDVFNPNVNQLDTPIDVYNSNVSHSDAIVDSGTTNTILKDPSLFTNLTNIEIPIHTIGSASTAIGHGPATVFLPNGTVLQIKNAIFMPDAKRNLLSFIDFKNNGYILCTNFDNGNLLMKNEHGILLETFAPTTNGLFITNIFLPTSFSTKVDDTFRLWHARLGHPGTTIMKKMIGKVLNLPLTTKQIPNDLHCVPCIQGKLKISPTTSTTVYQPPRFLERLHMDICGPINPPSGPFRYFQVLVCSSGKFEVTQLLSSKNQAFARLLTQLIRLRSQFPDYPIKTLRCDNAAEYTSALFDDYCAASGITLTYSTAHVHTQNGAAEAAIKRIQLIARPLLMQTQLPASCWGHAVLHASYLLKLRPSNYNDLTPHQLLNGFLPSAKHLRIFGCAVYIPIPPPIRTKMGPQRQLGIYVGCISAAIINYLDVTTGETFRARFDDCRFNEDLFPRIGDTTKVTQPILEFNTTHQFQIDPRTTLATDEVKSVLNLQRLASLLPDGFNDASGVTRSRGLTTSSAINAPSRVSTNEPPATTLPPLLKRGRPAGSKNKVKFAKVISEKELGMY